MKISVLSIFPESFSSFLSGPIVKRAIERGVVDFECVDLKDYSNGSFRHIDDSPYGGGAGMLIRVDTVKRALDSIPGESAHVVLLSPRGKLFDQQKAHELSHLTHLVLICGHYEGVDERVTKYVDEEISIGDYILTGGELSAMVVSDALIRLVDGTVKRESTTDESFENGLLEYPQYTHPYEFDSECVPSVLFSGDRRAISAWRLKHSVMTTVRRRPDLLPPSFSHLDYGPFILSRLSLEEYEREFRMRKMLSSRIPLFNVVDSCKTGEQGYILYEKSAGRSLDQIANEKRRLSLTVSLLRALLEEPVFFPPSLDLSTIYADSKGITGIFSLSGYLPSERATCAAVAAEALSLPLSDILSRV